MSYYLLVLGLAMTGFGLRLMQQRIKFLLGTQKTYGKLVNMMEDPQPDRVKTYYYAEVVFQASDGAEYRVRSEVGAGSYQKPVMPVDRKIPVRYNPQNPEEAQIDTLFNLWAPSLCFLIMGGVMLFASFHPKR